MSGPTKRKQQREEKTDEQSAFIAASNSVYNTCVPMLNAEHIRIHNPYTHDDIHCSTNSQTFLDTFKEFCEKGLEKKLVRELREFADKYDRKWEAVLARAAEHAGIDLSKQETNA